MMVGCGIIIKHLELYCRIRKSLRTLRVETKATGVRITDEWKEQKVIW